MKSTSLLILLSFFCFSLTKAQVSALPFSQSMDSFQVINGTIVDAPNEDDIFHPNLPLGFNFIYNGHVTNKFGLCTNGYIVMDSLNHPAPFFLSSNSKNQINVFMGDLRNTNTGGSIEYVTIGTAPNRICIIQWKDYGMFGIPYCHFNFQIHLFETSNCVQYIYGYNALSGLAGRTYYVGLTGDSTSDFNFRKCTTSWLNSNPATAYTGTANGMLLNALNTVPSGLVFSFGTCPATGLPFSYMTGNVYNDINNNGVKDAGELGMPNILVHESVQNYYSNTDSSGNYSMLFIDSNLSYSLTAIPATYWSISSTPSTYTVTPISGSVNNKDFGLYATPNIHDVKIVSTSTGNTWPNATQHIHATYSNQGTVIESGDSIFFVKDSLTAFISSNPVPSMVSGDSVVWTYTNLLINEFRIIDVVLKVDSTVVIGDSLDCAWTIKPLATDAAPINNVAEHHQACMASFDPNFKEVSPNGGIPKTQKELDYTIHFQNTGTAPAQNVFLYDTLDSKLDVSSFKLLGFSHPVTYTIDGPGYIRFTFAGINLPDSVNNEPMSHGFVNYSLKPKAGLMVGDKIHNTASIVFDYNAPVVTNTTENIVVEAIPNGLNNINNSLSNITVYPNPARQLITITSTENLSGANVYIYDMMGKLVVSKLLLNIDKNEININMLPTGWFLMKVQQKDAVSSFKLIKQ